MSVPTFLSGLSDDEARALQSSMSRIEGHAGWLRRYGRWYDGKNRVRDLNISTPPHLRDLGIVLGWPGMAVDVLEERLDIEGVLFAGQPDDDHGLTEIFDANNLDVESSQAHLDAFIYGRSYIAVGSGAAGEPDPLITVESPMNMIADYDPRRRRLSSACSFGWDRESKTATEATLYLPTQTIIASRPVGGAWKVDHRDEHNLGRVPVSRLVNRARSGSPHGVSEITPAIIGYTEAAVRTLRGMEVHREFYSAPQRWALNVSESAFQRQDGTAVSQWESVMGRFLALSPGDENDPTPQIGQFPSSSPAPYLEQLRGLAQLVAAEAAMPASYLGFVSDNPSSADAIRQGEARLVKRAERRQRQFSPGWREALMLALQIRDGKVPDTANTLQIMWADAGTPTKAAAADAVVKLVGAGILPANSDVTYEMLDLPESARRRLAAEARRSAGRVDVSALAAAAKAAQADPTVARLTQRAHG